MEEYFLILRSFIIYNLYDLTYGDMEMPSMSFDFKEEEAKEVITKLINNELKINCGSIDKDLADALNINSTEIIFWHLHFFVLEIVFTAFRGLEA